jgi:hypothetical protein
LAHSVAAQAAIFAFNYELRISNAKHQQPVMRHFYLIIKILQREA